MGKIHHKKLSILYPALHYPPVIGGIERWTKEIAERLSRKAEIFVATGKVRGQKNKENKGGLIILRSSLFSLKNLSHSPWWYTLHLLPFCYFKSAKIIKKEKIDIIHCNGFLSGWLGHKLKKRFNLPYIITIQSLQQSKPLQKCKKRVYAEADVCIAASRAIADYFEKIGVEKQKIVIIPNGIDISRFQGIDKIKSRKMLGLSANDFVVITVGRLDKRKGIGYLIKALRRPVLRQLAENGSPHLSLLIVGGGPERKNLEKLTQQLGLQNKVKFLGEIPNSKVPQYLAAADCFCLPSLEEGFGIVILEAMAAGLPVVATNVGGILDLIEDDKTGILVEKENQQAIAQALEKIYSQSEFAQSLVENSRAILPNYNWQNITEKVFEIYQQFL